MAAAYDTMMDKKHSHRRLLYRVGSAVNSYKNVKGLVGPVVPDTFSRYFTEIHVQLQMARHKSISTTRSNEEGFFLHVDAAAELMASCHQGYGNARDLSPLVNAGVKVSEGSECERRTTLRVFALEALAKDIAKFGPAAVVGHKERRAEFESPEGKKRLLHSLVARLREMEELRDMAEISAFLVSLHDDTQVASHGASHDDAMMDE